MGQSELRSNGNEYITDICLPPTRQDMTQGQWTEGQL